MRASNNFLFEEMTSFVPLNVDCKPLCHTNVLLSGILIFPYYFNELVPIPAPSDDLCHPKSYFLILTVYFDVGTTYKMPKIALTFRTFYVLIVSLDSF